MNHLKYAECYLDDELRLRFKRFISKKEYVEGKKNNRKVYCCNPADWRGTYRTVIEII